MIDAAKPGTAAAEHTGAAVVRPRLSASGKISCAPSGCNAARIRARA
jgi:hypothetical protein